MEVETEAAALLQAGVGSTLVCQDMHDDEVMTYTLVETEPNPREGRLLASSSLGRILMGRRVGEEVRVGQGRFKILEVR